MYCMWRCITSQSVKYAMKNLSRQKKSAVQYPLICKVLSFPNIIGSVRVWLRYSNCSVYLGNYATSICWSYKHNATVTLATQTSINEPLCSLGEMHCTTASDNTPYSNNHGVNMGPIWGRQVSGGSHVGPMDLALWDSCYAFDQTAVVMLFTSHIFVRRTADATLATFGEHIKESKYNRFHTSW